MCKKLHSNIHVAGFQKTLSTILIDDLFEFEPVAYSITLFQILTTTTAHSSPHQQITRDKPCG